MKSARPPHVSFDRKVSVVLDDKTPATRVLIVVAHLMMSLGKHAEDLVGRQMTDKSGNTHLALAKYPVVLLQADSRALRKAVKQGKADGVLVVDFPIQALDIWTDEELVRDIQDHSEEQLDFLGAAFFSTPRAVSRLTGSFALYRPKVS